MGRFSGSDSTPYDLRLWSKSKGEESLAKRAKRLHREWRRDLAYASAELEHAKKKLAHATKYGRDTEKPKEALIHVTQIMANLSRRMMRVRGTIHTVRGDRYIVTKSGAWRRLAA